MPSVSHSTRVLVTGASGFLGGHVVRALLDHNYYVKGAVRSSSKGDRLRVLFGERFEYVVVEDMTKPVAFDSAVLGVEAVVHTAAPLPSKATDNPNDILDEAVSGTSNLLHSILNSASVKRVVYVGAAAAAKLDADGGLGFNDEIVTHVKDPAAPSNQYMQYAASKVLSERAAWSFIKENDVFVPFDLVSIIPPLIIGPMSTDPENDSEGQISESVLHFLHGLSKQTSTESYVDVRDLAKIITLLIGNEVVGGKRFLAMAGFIDWASVTEVLNGATEGGVNDSNAPHGSLDASSPSSLETALGISRNDLYRPFKRTVRDTLASAIGRGWYCPVMLGAFPRS